MIESHPITTERLQEDEKKILPLLISFLASHKGKDKAITSFALCFMLNDYIANHRSEFGARFKIAGARLRKMINYIRIERRMHALCGFEAGYFIATDIEDLRIAIRSLRARAAAIAAVSDALEKDLDLMANPMNLQDDRQLLLF